MVLIPCVSPTTGNPGNPSSADWQIRWSLCFTIPTTLKSPCRLFVGIVSLIWMFWFYISPFVLNVGLTIREPRSRILGSRSRILDQEISTTNSRDFNLEHSRWPRFHSRSRNLARSRCFSRFFKNTFFRLYTC